MKTSGGGDKEDTRTRGLGYMSVLEDQQLVEQIFIFLTAEQLCKLSRVSKAAYLFAHYGDLWRELTMDYFGGDWTYRESWMQTYADAHIKAKGGVVEEERKNEPIVVEGFYSDLLYDEWQSSMVDLKIWAEQCPDNIDRRSGLSLEEFDREYGIPNKPVILTDVVPKWPAWKKWTKELLIQRFEGKTFEVGRIKTTLDKYFKYCERSKDEKPLYLFDNGFGEKYPDLLDDYTVPEYFQTDYFSLLSKEDRPSYRWMLMGPPRSGSSFHKDPNSTSAWNALISGLKLWIMYPPEVSPPAVFPSKDELLVTTPVSVTEWMLRFYKETKRSKAPVVGGSTGNSYNYSINSLKTSISGDNASLNTSSPQQEPNSSDSSPKTSSTLPNPQNTNSNTPTNHSYAGKTYEQVRPIECLQRPGDLIFIPNGWWHQVLNIEECIGVTQNVVCDHNLLNVVKFLRAKKKQEVWNGLSSALREHYPGKLELVDEIMSDSKRKFEVIGAQRSEEESKDIVKPQTFSFLKRS